MILVHEVCEDHLLRGDKKFKEKALCINIIIIKNNFGLKFLFVHLEALLHCFLMLSGNYLCRLGWSCTLCFSLLQLQMLIAMPGHKVVQYKKIIWHFISYMGLLYKSKIMNMILSLIHTSVQKKDILWWVSL